MSWPSARRAARGSRGLWRNHTWWPSQILLLDGKGARLGAFVHAGSVRALAEMESRGRSVIIAGGVANAHRAAFVAVLDATAVRGHGPVPPGSPFEALDGDTALPLRYFLFPPSDINGASGLPYNSVLRILIYPDAFEVFTREQNGDASPIAEMSFRFSADFDLLDARSSDSFAAHEFYERAGKLDHPASRCPWYLKPPPVREWTPGGGWRDVAPTLSREPRGSVPARP